MGLNLQFEEQKWMRHLYSMKFPTGGPKKDAHTRATLIEAMHEIFNAGNMYWNSLMQRFTQMIETGRFRSDQCLEDAGSAMHNFAKLARFRQKTLRDLHLSEKIPPGSSGTVSIISWLFCIS